METVKADDSLGHMCLHTGNKRGMHIHSICVYRRRVTTVLLQILYEFRYRALVATTCGIEYQSHLDAHWSTHAIQIQE